MARRASSNGSCSATATAPSADRSRAAAVDGHGLRSALHQVTGDRDHGLEHGLDAARVRPRSEITSCACERRADVAHRDHDLAPRHPRCGDHSAQPARACEEIHVQAERMDPDESNAARIQGDDSPGCSPAAHRATPDVQRACGRATKYTGKGVLHDLARRDAGLRRTRGDSLSCPTLPVVLRLTVSTA